ncbi:Chromosome partition protein Smc [Carpediemonas membranifera]|uniref:Chromosome partition protein Smc n=1 Tax=Carpediemonas membranifera TaxID=201153 RepID=A0A8J6E2H0_9EUKA|nr:Chromosome partition protein Smc [Carpediemonas membranifera]|eukprot:KAG9394316.1 Chromosome partition protein Smc [Carpediemonas membranifera]
MGLSKKTGAITKKKRNSTRKTKNAREISRKEVDLSEVLGRARAQLQAVKNLMANSDNAEGIENELHELEADKVALASELQKSNKELKALEKEIRAAQSETNDLEKANKNRAKQERDQEAKLQLSLDQVDAKARILAELITGHPMEGQAQDTGPMALRLEYEGNSGTMAIIPGKDGAVLLQIESDTVELPEEVEVQAGSMRSVFAYVASVMTGTVEEGAVGSDDGGDP